MSILKYEIILDLFLNKLIPDTKISVSKGNKIFGAFLLIALLGLLLFNLARFFISISRPTVRAGAIFGAVLFSLFLLYDFNYIKQREDLVSNNWETALEMAFILYLDIINLLLEILDAMGNS